MPSYQEPLVYSCCFDTETDGDDQFGYENKLITVVPSYSIKEYIFRIVSNYIYLSLIHI